MRILVGAAYGNPVPAVGSPVPRLLPRAVPGFVGRTEHLAALDAVPAGDTAAIVGTAGAGKTSLAVQWAHQAQHRFPDGTLYVNLRGYDPGTPAMPGDVLADFLSALGTSPEGIPPHVDARAAKYRSELVGRQVLIVLDNASDVRQVRPLLPGGTGCVVVVTSRGGLEGLEVFEGARRVSLALFSESEAVELVRTMLGPRADAEPEAVAALVHACARLPLALRIAAGRVATHPHLTIAELVGQLESERWQVLSTPADESGVVRTVFDWSYRWLGEPQALMFRRLGLHPTAEIGVHAAAALSGLDLRAAELLLADLAEQHLVEPVGPGRYTCHDLLRAYAADLSERDGDRDEARHRMLEWYAHHARKAYRTLFPDRGFIHERIELVTDGRPELAFSGSLEAWAWCDRELVNGTAAVRVAAHHGFSSVAMLLADICAGALILAGHQDDAMEVCQTGLTAARGVGDRWVECWLLQGLAQLYRAANRWHDATDVLDSALALARDLDDTVLESEVLCHLGWGHLQLGEFEVARGHLEAVRPLLSGRKSLAPAFVECCLSGVHAGLGDHESALRYAERSLALLEASGVMDVAGHAMQAMARAKQLVAAHDEAIMWCERAFASGDRLEIPWSRAILLETYGESLRHTGERERAIECWREALAIFEQHGDHRAPDLRTRLAAEVSAMSG